MVRSTAQWAAARASGPSRGSRAREVRIAYSVGRLERAVRRGLGRVTRRAGVTVAQYTALSVLDARGALSNAQLARRTLVSPQAMNEIVQAMTERGLLAREPHRRHGRIVVIRLTAKGRRILERCDRGVGELERAMLARLAPAQRTRLRELLGACIEALEHGPEGARGPGARARSGAGASVRD